MARLSRTKKKRLFAVIVCVLVVACAFVGAVFLCSNQLKSKYDLKLEEMATTISNNQRNVYRALVDIPAGTEINSENTEWVTVFSDMDDFVYMGEDGIGKIATADIFAGQNICANMVGDDLAFSLRECEYALLTLSNNLSTHDFVDIRIMYPNGENYVVLSKKCIQSIDLENNAAMFWLCEDEIMDMSSAIVDTYLHEGSILYTTKYIQDAQDELERSYQPSADCMVAIANDPNIIGEAKDALTERMSATLRSSLENRLNSFSGKSTQGEGTSSGAGANIDLSNSIRAGSYTGEDVADAMNRASNSSSDGNNSDTGFSFGPEDSDPSQDGNSEPSDSLSNDTITNE